MLRSTLLPLAIAIFIPLAAAQEDEITTTRIAAGIAIPTSLSSPPEDPSRLFVTSAANGVRIIKDGDLLPTPFLDMSAILTQNNEGLSCLAFHPDYATNGKFYITFMDASDTSHLMQYQVSSDPDLADPDSGVDLLTPQLQPNLVHNWNCLAFGPDGMLYASFGDGGPNDDPNNEAQDLNSLFGKILRLDVDAPAPYIPANNPFVGLPNHREEIWAYGLREPWRISFDSLTGDLWIGDVGQGHWEELDFQPASSAGGENYGWRCKEGSHCTSIAGCGCDDPTAIDPIYDYDHLDGKCCVIGGHVYRGAALPELQGCYFFADFCSGQIWSLRYDGSQVSDLRDRTAELANQEGHAIDLITSFGVDALGELYILDKTSSEIFKVIRDEGCRTTNYCDRSPNSAGNGAVISNLGTPSVTANDFILRCTQAPPNQYALFYYGPNAIQVPFVDGYRCVGGDTWRLNPATQTDSRGRITRPVELPSPPNHPASIQAGTTWNFQLWFRDPNGPVGTGSNLSDALTVTFCL
jgi:glucose/arabinose dehydrogenase